MKKNWAFAWLLFVSFGFSLAIAPFARSVEINGNEVDPWESFNRKVFRFNETLDTHLLKPVAQAYRFVTPGIVDKGVTNMFHNIDDIKTLVYSLLQLKVIKSARSASRVMFNSTYGLLGFFDIATWFGLERSPEDLGQVLAHWGVGRGYYLVLPLLGPSTTRDGAGKLVEMMYLEPSIYLVDESVIRYSLTGVKLVDVRADLIPKEGLIIGDKYSFVRSSYLQYREFLINDGVVDDPFAREDEDYLDDF
ncbi:MAG: hypothetical protein CSB48_11570 [Proteobacteria bacterium]|nr:MAG: hypothetical protein CSB48_11570 [Pseudomonadota bacterium]PIE40112.1 MAG: hypothetical protein CSA51_02425 [Gammaproteobacteria bacterium]